MHENAPGNISKRHGIFWKLFFKNFKKNSDIFKIRQTGVFVYFHLCIIFKHPQKYIMRAAAINVAKYGHEFSGNFHARTISILFKNRASCFR